MDHVFDNGYKAILIYNERSKQHTARLYSPKDRFICSANCTPETFRDTAEGLMQGFFAGGREEHLLLSERVIAALGAETEQP